MRCEHTVEKKHLLTRKTRLRPCRRRVRVVMEELLIGHLMWRVYRCRQGHETRLFVKP